MSATAVLETTLPDLSVRRGKVRDIYDLGDQLLFVATDRISAFDWVLPTGIPDKGKVLNQISTFWFEQLDEPNHLISTDPPIDLLPPGTDMDQFAGRSMVVKKTKVVPIECVVRGYLVGSGWGEYQRSQSVCGIELPAGLRESDQLATPIFTPSTKVDDGHDENISFQRMCEIVGQDVSEELRERSLALYQRGAEIALEKGIIVADTKFEWGWDGDQLIVIDEVLTPDSSRFWPADRYEPGKSQPSFDKQFVRDWLSGTDWDKNSTPPELPEDIVQKTRERYVEALERISGKGLE